MSAGMNTRMLATVVAVAMVGCSGAGEPGSSTGALDIRDTETGIAGSYESSEDLGRVDFTSEFVDTNVLDIGLELHGLSITALVDYDSGVIEYDGFTTSTGAATQIMDDDRALIAELARALDALGTDVPEVTQHLRSFASTWSEFPTTLDPQFQVLMDEERGWTSLCGRLNTYYRAGHDCSTGGWWADNTTVDGAYLSMHGAGSCSDGTFFAGSSWSCYEPNHSTSVENAYGNCFGRCGAGCGGSTQFTVDCHNHDECVRFGHDTASWWCDDQFTSASDDWSFAPNC